MDTAIELSKLPDKELLRLLCSTADDDRIFNEFVNRFWPDIDKECSKICQNRKIDPQIGSEIAHETFDRVRKYKSFKEDEIKIKDDRKAILVYLIRISVRLFNNYHSKNNKQDIIHRTYFDDLADTVNGSFDVKDLKQKKDVSVKILKKLTHKEQRVLLVDMEYKRHQKYLPDDVLDTLAEELKVKKDTIRKIRERAIDKLQKAIDEINQN